MEEKTHNNDSLPSVYDIEHGEGMKSRFTLNKEVRPVATENVQLQVWAN